MKLYFKVNRENEEYLGEFINTETCCRRITAYLKAHGYDTSYTWRLVGTEPKLMIDFGSYSAFFYVEGISFNEFLPGFQNYTKEKLDMEMKEHIYKEAVTDAVNKIKACTFGEYVSELQVVRLEEGSYGTLQLFYSLKKDSTVSIPQIVKFEEEIEAILGIEDKEDGYWGCVIGQTNTEDYLRWHDDCLVCWREDRPNEVTFDRVSPYGPRFVATNKVTKETIEFGFNDLYTFDSYIYIKGMRDTYLSFYRLGINMMNPTLKIREVNDGKDDARVKLIETVNNAVRYLVESEFGKKYITRIVSAPCIRGGISIGYFCNERPPREEQNEFQRKVSKTLMEKYPVSGFDCYLVMGGVVGAEEDDVTLITLWDKIEPDTYSAEKLFVKKYRARDERGNEIAFDLEDVVPFMTRGFAGVEVRVDNQNLTLNENSHWSYLGMVPGVQIIKTGEKWRRFE